MIRVAVLVFFLASSAGAEGFRWRGVLEGFYGQPWTWKKRGEMVDWMAACHDNLFVLAPKDEELQRKRWREPLPPEYLQELSALQKRGAQRGVTLAWELSPLGARLSDETDVAAAVAKFRSVLATGTRKLVIAFDDTELDYRHIDFANNVLEALSPDFPDLEMTFVPAVYWGKAAPSKYLGRVAALLDPRFIVAWTGPGIISETITAEDGRRFRDYIKHRTVLGDNYPVQDRLLDSGPLYLGPLLGREAGLVDSQEGFLSNASPLAEASKVPLQTAADFARDPARYNPEKSWRKALEDNDIPEWLAAECATSWISDPPPNWLERLSLSSALIRVRNAREAREFQGRLSRSFFKTTAELQPWADCLADRSRLISQTLVGKREHTYGGSSDGAVVSNLDLDRFLLGQAQFRLQGCPDQASGDVDSSLRRLAGSDGFIATAAPNEWARQLAPWFDVLAQSARRALHSIDHPGGSLIPDSIWRWRTRLRFLPLLTSRALLESHLDQTERLWKTPGDESRPLGWLGVWLWAERWVKPSAFPVVLSQQLQRYRENQHAAPLERSFIFLENFPTMIRRGAGARMIVETGPWLDKVALYGRLGRLSLEYAGRIRAGGKLTEKEKAEWDHLRLRQASANGLELAARLKFTLDDFVRWRRIPKSRRPPRFKVEWPADPGKLL